MPAFVSANEPRQSSRLGRPLLASLGTSWLSSVTAMLTSERTLTDAVNTSQRCHGNLTPGGEFSPVCRRRRSPSHKLRDVVSRSGSAALVPGAGGPVTDASRNASITAPALAWWLPPGLQPREDSLGGFHRSA